MSPLPPLRFTTGVLKERDVNFCYGSRDGYLWHIFNAIFNLKLHFETTQHAIEERNAFLLLKWIGICDIVASANIDKVGATDIGVQGVVFRDVVAVLRKFLKIDTLIIYGWK